MQSPIDVTTEEVLFDPELRNNPLNVSYYHASTAHTATDDEDEDGGGGGQGSSREKLVLVNTGNTARLDVINASSCKLIIMLMGALKMTDMKMTDHQNCKA